MSETAAVTQEKVARSLRRRYWAERRFRAYGLAAVLLGIGFVVFLFATIVGQGVSVFRQTYVQLDVFFDPAVIDPAGTRKPADLAAADYKSLVSAALRERFPAVEGRKASRELARLVSSGGAFELQRLEIGRAHV